MKLLIGLGLALAAGAFAGPITYTLTGTGTGSLTVGSTVTPFTSQNYVLSVTTDTSLITFSSNVYFSPNLSNVQFSVSGVGSGTATSMDVFDNQLGLAGFQDAITTNILGNTGAFSLTYQMTTALATSSGPAFGALNQPFSTSFGTVQFSSISNSTFGAVLGSSTVPEPGTLVFSGLGLVGMVVVRKRLAKSTT